MKPLAVMLLFCLCSTGAYAQCADTFELTSVEKASGTQDDGKITLKVNTSRSYACELLSYRNANRITVAEKSGRGSGTIIFEKLNNTDFYRIIFTFPEEDDPLCRSRIIDPIILTGNNGKL